MGLLSTIGTVGGGIVGAYFGNPALGAKIGGTIGGAVEGGGDDKKSSRSVTPASTAIDNVGLMNPSSVTKSEDEIEVAQGVDPWVLRDNVNSWFTPIERV